MMYDPNGYGSNNYRHHRQGGLTSALMGIVDAIDNHLATSHNHAGAGGGVGDGRQHQRQQQQQQQSPSVAVPPLHRSDGGLGGIGRASESVSNASQYHGNATSAGAGADMDEIGDGRRMSEEESSLAIAREFLSRLLFMLACFVILCLLLF